MDLTCLLKIDLTLETNNNDSLNILVNLLGLSPKAKRS